MLQVTLALIAGFLLGGVFSMIKLPLPAPPTLAGVAGIVGIYFGHVVYQNCVQGLVS
jgi:XapX domain-containing protein